MNKKISTPLAIIIIILCAVLVGGIVLWQYLEMPEKKTLGTKLPKETIPEYEIPKDETADWKTYRNEEYGFEIKYPKNWTIKEETKEYTDATAPYEKYYRLDIFHPKNITEAKTYGSIAVVFFRGGNGDNFFKQQLNIMRKDLTLGDYTLSAVNA